jgi:hypothetical protein
MKGYVPISKDVIQSLLIIGEWKTKYIHPNIATNLSLVFLFLYVETRIVITSLSFGLIISIRLSSENIIATLIFLNLDKSLPHL